MAENKVEGSLADMVGAVERLAALYPGLTSIRLASGDHCIELHWTPRGGTSAVPDPDALLPDHNATTQGEDGISLKGSNRVVPGRHRRPTPGTPFVAPAAASKPGEE